LIPTRLDVDLYIHAVDFMASRVLQSAILVVSDEGSNSGGAVCIAYIMKRFSNTPKDSFILVKERAKSVSMNQEIAKSLKEYYQVLITEEEVVDEPTHEPEQDANPENEPASRPTIRVVYTQPVERVVDITRVDDSNEPAEVSHYSCRNCRMQLFTDSNISIHESGDGQTSFKSWNKRDKTYSVECNSYFLEEPEPWMTELDSVQGKLCCSCGHRLGTWKWQGVQCSCGAWVVPGIQITKNRVDVVRMIEVKPSEPAYYI